MAANYNSPGVKPRIKYVYEDVPEETPKSKKNVNPKKTNKLKDSQTPPLKKKTGKVSDVGPDVDIQVVSTSTKKVDIKFKFAKFAIFACCMISVLVGFGMLALGAYLKSDLSFSQFLSENYRQVTETQFTAPTLYKATWALIVVGSVTVVFSFMGFCGAITENVAMLGTFLGVLIIIFLLQITCGVLWYFRRDAIQQEMALALDYMVQHYYQGPGIVQEVMDSLQTVFRCCGNSGCGDYIALRLTVPRSCDLDCYGCRERVYRVLRDGFTVITVFGIAMLLAEILAIVCAMYLICRIKDRPPSPPMVYDLALKTYPGTAVESPSRSKRQLPPNPGTEYASPSSNPTKIVYVAYPVHSMPPPPPYDVRIKRTPPSFPER